MIVKKVVQDPALIISKATGALIPQGLNMWCDYVNSQWTKAIKPLKALEAFCDQSTFIGFDVKVKMAKYKTNA